MMWKYLVLVVLVISLTDPGKAVKTKTTRAPKTTTTKCDSDELTTTEEPTTTECGSDETTTTEEPTTTECGSDETTTTEEPTTTECGSDETTTTEEPTTTECGSDDTTTTEEPTTAECGSDDTTTTEEPTTTECGSDDTTITEEPTTTDCGSDETTTTEEPTTTYCGSDETTTTEEPTTTEFGSNDTTTTEEPTTEECPSTGLTTCLSTAINCNCVDAFKRILTATWAVTIKYAYEIYAQYNKNDFVCSPSGFLNYHALFSQFSYKNTLDEFLNLFYQKTSAQVQCVYLKLNQLVARLKSCGENNKNYEFCAKNYIYSNRALTQKFASLSEQYNINAQTKNDGGASRSLSLVSDIYLRSRWRKGFEGKFKDNFYVTPTKIIKNVVYQYKTEVCKYIYCPAIKAQIVKVDNAGGISTLVFLPDSGVDNAQVMQLILKNPLTLSKCINAMKCKNIRLTISQTGITKTSLNVKPIFNRTWGNLTIYNRNAQTSGIFKGRDDVAYVGGISVKNYEFEQDFKQADKDSVSEDECAGVTRPGAVISIKCNRPAFFVKTFSLNMNCKTTDCQTDLYPFTIRVFNSVE